MRYLQHDSHQLKDSVVKILNRDIDFTVKYNDAQETIDKDYTLIVPFQKVDRFFEYQKKSNKKSSIFYNVKPYLKMIQESSNRGKSEFNNDLIDLAKRGYRDSKLSMEDFVKVNNHIVDSSVCFIKCLFALEKYYVWKNKQSLQGGINRFSTSEIDDLSDYFSEDTLPLDIRNRALHFNLPTNNITYRQAMLKLEEQFLQKEINLNYLEDDFSSLGSLQRNVLQVFLNCIRDQEFYSFRLKGKEKLADAIKKYSKYINKKLKYAN